MWLLPNPIIPRQQIGECELPDRIGMRRRLLVIEDAVVVQIDPDAETESSGFALSGYDEKNSLQAMESAPKVSDLAPLRRIARTSRSAAAAELEGSGAIKMT